ncbi:50S ribosomal protein L29 [Desulfoluna spongiiphila]|uniref:Large ribosomal subunit protein uL29 n=1 Tax=Desulfoluna spongiiphila TaxID=419481 RepID=A0A1G5IVJ9_9BACT|nr:50S ribosomal protein L29 [Desulfoluna spongiiphila]SCY80123.1 LSU ribosomal protein L29P [Desulfoluna spongiiphila]VVS93313.1 ribosomal protein l29/l35 [Desulfoluna spongiiphila]
MKIKDIRAMGKDDLKAKLQDLKEEHFNLRFQHGVGQLEKTSTLKSVRRDIARVETVIREN